MVEVDPNYFILESNMQYFVLHMLFTLRNLDLKCQENSGSNTVDWELKYENGPWQDQHGIVLYLCRPQC